MTLHIYCGGPGVPRKRLAVQVEPISAIAAAAIVRGAGSDYVSHIDDYEDAYFISRSLGFIVPVAEDVAHPAPEVGDVILQASVTYLSDLTWTVLSLEEAP